MVYPGPLQILSWWGSCTESLKSHPGRRDTQAGRALGFEWTSLREMGRAQAGPASEQGPECQEEAIFPPLTRDGDLRKGSMDSSGEKRISLKLFCLFMDLQEEQFLLISLSRHRSSPTGLVSSSSNFPCSVSLAEDGEQVWKLIPAIMQGQHQGCSTDPWFETEMNPILKRSNLFADFWL